MWIRALAWLAASVAISANAAAPPVLQRGYDANVSGANLVETALNTSNVGPNTFGLLFNLPVDERIFAQPLYVPLVAIPGQGTHNVLYVATMNDSVYAFDADAGGAALWSINLAGLFGTTAPVWNNFAINSVTVRGNLGILSTPVIDPATNIMYVVACMLENGTMAYRLYALDITTGAEPYGPGVLITGTYGGATFDARYMLQRASLVLSGNAVVVAFSGLQNEEQGNYVGFVMAYNKLTLQQSGIFATTPTTSGGGVWQSGRPPAVDSAGYVYLFTGNAFGNGYDGVNNFCESVLKFDTSQGLKLVDWFTAGNWSVLDTRDQDLGSSGPMLVPGTTLLAGGGKTGNLYVLNTTSLGKWVANDSQVVQKENITSGLQIHGGPVYWNRSVADGGPLMYDWAVGDILRAFPFNGSTFATSPSAVGTTNAMAYGGMLALSANAGQQSSGLLWATTSITSTGFGVLHAYDANNIQNELWNSMMSPTRDGYGALGKWVPPVVVNGKVYVPTFSNRVAVYGLGVAPPTFTVTPTLLPFGNVSTNGSSTGQTVTVTNTGSAAVPITSITFTGTNPGQFSQTNNCGTSVAVGSKCTISVVLTPAGVGSQTAWLNVNAGSGLGTKTSALSGTGVSPVFSLSPTSVAFGNVQTGSSSAQQLVTVANSSGAPLPITSITITGADPSAFSQTNTCGTSIPTGSTCTIGIVFTPTLAAYEWATLNVSSGSGATQNGTVNGTGIVTYTLTPATLAFGTIKANTSSAPQSFTVTNTGNAALSVTGISFAGANPTVFAYTTTCGQSLAVGSACTISVVFTPTSIGYAWAKLKVTGSKNTQTAIVNGTGN
jgi:hypothetical protein